MKLEYYLQDIELIAQKIIETNPEKVILFNGEMGVGKTTLINQIVVE